MTTGARLLRKHLEETGLSYRAFGALAGVGAPEICGYLAGEGLPSLKAAFAIDDASRGAVPARSWLLKSTSRVAA